MKRTSISFLLIMLVFTAFAQEDTTVKKAVIPATADSVAKKPVVPKGKSYFSASLSYLTNSVYNGRKDTATTPYITPIIGYYDKSGFYIDAAISYLAKAGSGRIDLFNIEAGYDFYLGNFDGEISANKSFYNSASTNVQSTITGSVFGMGSYDFTYIKPTIEAGINFGTKSDYVFNFGLEHTFYLLNDKLRITPGIKANGGTQNYYDSYYNKRKLKTKKKGDVTYEVSASVEDASNYKVLDYEFSMPVSYKYKKFTFSILPVYALPVNPALVNVHLVPVSGGNTITRTSAEVISNSFYCSFGVSFKL